MVENKEKVLNLLEEQISLLEKDINIKLEKEYLKIENLKKAIKKISNESIY